MRRKLGVVAVAAAWAAPLAQAKVYEHEDGIRRDFAALQQRQLRSDDADALILAVCNDGEVMCDDLCRQMAHSGHAHAG